MTRKDIVRELAVRIADAFDVVEEVAGPFDEEETIELLAEASEAARTICLEGD